jgi:hypothetical protein
MKIGQRMMSVLFRHRKDQDQKQRRRVATARLAGNVRRERARVESKF